MPLLQAFKPEEKSEKPKWVKMAQTERVVAKSDIYVLGHPDIKMPAVVSTSSIPGVKARLVTIKDTQKMTSAAPTSLGEDDIKVIKEWKFEEPSQTIPIYFSNPLHMDKTFWVEMQNPTKEDAVVNSLVHGIIRSKNL